MIAKNGEIISLSQGGELAPLESSAADKNPANLLKILKGGNVVSMKEITFTAEACGESVEID